MKEKIFMLLLVVILVVGFIKPAMAAPEVKEIKVGLVYCLTGPLAPGGGIASQRGSILAIDAINDRGGVLGKYKVVPVIVDAQSSPDIAVREIERLVGVERCPIIIGSFSSGIAVPSALTCEKHKTIWWNSVAVSDGVVQGKHYRYVFRPGPFASDYGRNAVQYIYDNYKKLGFKDRGEIKLASLTEDGPYGSMVRSGNREQAKKLGVSLAYDESYSHTTKDLSSVILKMKASKADILCHAGYAPDIILFHKQARELGLRVKAVIGEGTVYANNEAMAKALGKEAANYLHNIDICPLQLRDRTKAKPEHAKLFAEFSERALKKYNDPDPMAHYSFSFTATWFLFDTVLPIAIKKYGGVTPDAVRQASMEIDIPNGETAMWYGVKFNPPESEYAGQNARSFPVVTQWIDGKQYVVFPESLRTIEPVLPLPAQHPLAQK